MTKELYEKYDFIYVVAVLHILVFENYRNSFYEFIVKHLKESGIGLICTMGEVKKSDNQTSKMLFSCNKENMKKKVKKFL